MNAQWQDFLTTRGAQVASDGGVRFPTAETSVAESAPACVLFDLSHLGLIAVRGEDSETFLQGQLTNDIREVSDTHSQLSSQCSAKGRILASLRVLRLWDGIYLQLPRERLPDTLKRLRLYVLRAKVTLEDASDTLVRVGLVGDCAEERLRALGLGIPERDQDLETTDGVCVLRLPSVGRRFELIGSVDRLIPLWDALAPGTILGTPGLWALEDIRAGIPTVFRETLDTFVPQMLNLQLIDGVSFTKGCYLGQEIVARMQYLGKLKRRMYWAEVETDSPPRPGDQLQAPASRSEQAGGWIVDAQASGPGRYEMLVVVEVQAAEEGRVLLAEQGPELRLAPPPYGFS